MDRGGKRLAVRLEARDRGRHGGAGFATPIQPFHTKLGHPFQASSGRPTLAGWGATPARPTRKQGEPEPKPEKR